MAQTPTGFPAVDSANVARAAWRRGQLALRANDTLLAHREIARAASAWPTQPAYVWGHAQMSARARDAAPALAALTLYADYGLGADIRTDPLFAPLVQRPEFADVTSRLARNAQPDARSTVLVTFADSSLWPEGMDYDLRRRRWLAASVRHGVIAETGDASFPRELWKRGQSRIGAMLAVRADTARGVIWATTSGLPQTEGYVRADSSIAALLEVRAEDGVILRRWDLPVIAGGHTLGDVAVGANGEVYVTDSNQPVLYRLRSERDTLESITSPLFRSLQGIAPAPDGRVLYVADYSHGILRVDLQSGLVARIDDVPRTTSLGCDGIAWDRGAIICVQNGVAQPRVMRFVLDGGGVRFTRAQLLDRNLLIADEPTIGAVVGGQFVYVANSQWEKYSDDGVLKPGSRLSRAILLAVPLP